MTPTEALLAITCLGPPTFYAGCLFGARYPWLILGRNRHGNDAY